MSNIKLFNYLNKEVDKVVDSNWLRNNHDYIKSVSVVDTNNPRFPVVLVVHLKHRSYMRLEINFVSKKICTKFIENLNIS